MNLAPEGLDYGTDDDKYCHADKPTSELEKGKYDTARHGHHGELFDDAETLRMRDGGSHDPVYESKRKNK